MRPDSLAFRLIAGASLWSAIALVVAGVFITTLYRQTVEGAFDDRLHVYLNTLIGSLAGQEPGQPLASPGNLGEQRFEALYSGWYWQVREPNGGPVTLASRSLFSDVIDVGRADNPATAAGVTTASLTGPTGEALRVLSRTIAFDDGRAYDILVAGDAGEMRNQIASFRASVALALAVLGLGLIAATLVQSRWGLRPLDRVRRGLTAMRRGEQTRFAGRYPAEIEPLVNELNALLDANREVVERSRTQVGNLAHALKTPLSVVINEARASRSPLGRKVAEQGELMRRQVNHYLDRARIAGQANVIGAVTEAAPVLTRLIRAMNRIHAASGVHVVCDIPADARFRGEQQDLEEIVGNLVDNACKWARATVTVAGEYARPDGEDDTGRLRLIIDDDGPGLTAEEIEEVGRRGLRLDETKPGSGLGLSIVTDLVAMYHGGFRLDRSPSGGLRAEIELPAG
jgi:signal transduction histidine kinase